MGKKNPTTNPQEIQSFRDTCTHKQVTAFFIFYINLFEQLHEQFKKNVSKVRELMLLGKMLSFDIFKVFQASIH